MKRGSVLRLHLAHTHPPKTKLIVILANDDKKISYACVLINSEINLNVINSNELVDLQHPILQSKNTFLTWDSFVDCSQVFLKDFEELKNAFDSNNHIRIGFLHADDLEIVLEKVKNAETTLPIIVKTFKF